MSDDNETKQEKLERISKELSASRLSRRGLLDRLKGLGVGFGAAFMLGMKQSDAYPDATAKLKSTNPALSKIIDEGPQVPPAGESGPEAEEPRIQTAYSRAFRRVFRRVYGRI
jgi:hypothetical protein